MAKRILVIDDEQLILKSIERALIKVGYSVTVVDGREAFLSEAEKGPYDLVIMDLNMRDLSADEIRKKIVETSEDVKFLVISGGNFDKSRYFLQKPFRIDDLRETVRGILNSD